jgi:glycosyltransferase involved in cell wall biosynthesis
MKAKVNTDPIIAKQPAEEKDRPELSIVIATYNEEANIGKCLETIKNLADEIVIVDGESQDQTRQIAKSFGARIIKTTNKPIFHINKQLGVEEARGRWVLQLDADERVSKDLAQEIKRVVSQDLGLGVRSPYVAYWIKRKNFFLGKFLTKGGVYPDPVIRLFKKGTAHLPCQSVHEQFRVDGPVGWLKNDLVHLADPSFTRYLQRNNRYTSLMAQEKIQNKEKLGLLPFVRYFLVKPVSWFLLTFIRCRGFVDGFPGFIFSLFSSLRFPIAYVKYWEMKKQKKEKVDLNQDWE